MNRYICLNLVLVLGACRSEPNEPAGPCSPKGEPGDLVLNEVVSNNEGVWVDQTGETDDWVEILNASDRTIELADFFLAQRPGPIVQTRIRSDR